MLRAEFQGIPLYQFPSLQNVPGLIHGITTKLGGKSQEPVEAFNLALGKEPEERTCDNLKLLRRALGLEAIASVRQVHGDHVVRVNGGEAYPAGEADGLMTDRPGLGLLIKQADCQALVLAAPGKAVGNFHVGWRGNVSGFPKKAVQVFCREFGLRPSELHAAVSPSLGPCCGEFINYRKELPRDFRPYKIGECNFDLWAITLSQLVSAGVWERNIEISGLCTKCEPDFYSHRGGDAGRFGTVVALKG